MAARILIADDEPHIVHLLTMKLAEARYEVLSASDGLQALEMCRQYGPDVVVADYRMPGLTGLEFCRRLRATPYGANTPVLMVTALAFEIPLEQLTEAGVAGVISKPFSPRDVLRRIGNLLDLPGQATA